MGNNKQQILNALGPELYKTVYDFIKYHRRKGTDERIMHSEIKNMVNGSKSLMNYCF